MIKNPLINSLAATVYIALISWVLYYGTVFKIGNNSFFAPIALISLFTLSAAVMGYLFCYQPIQLYFDGKKKSAVQLFLQTLIAFASTTTLILIILFARSSP
jgi:hypothetical protein